MTAAEDLSQIRVFIANFSNVVMLSISADFFTFFIASLSIVVMLNAGFLAIFIACLHPDRLFPRHVLHGHLEVARVLKGKVMQFST